ncbi:phosphomannose isomerase type II C-terminal cupin domain [Merismopedia glauca]|uniref:Mannose-6-phosphate isomerase n=1 Tax=Merismopedia glauca CCAP 1448/3 TaxID=1296344 RepID=A0A2T1C220_9CYAN|nr:phosphomannose isomerase type II C-terminal cupin domain [Merismopedia glauca]PSB02163.1 mannose-6-phosphate isomerase [Merismopedia glauca CCAP 1448/3]
MSNPLDLPSPTNPLTPQGTTRIRPWGRVTTLEEGQRYRINRVEIEPGHHISTQMHYHRSEHWIVVSGTAKVILSPTETLRVGGACAQRLRQAQGDTCQDEPKLLLQKQSTYVPMCTPHRIENPGAITLVLIEVQNGEYLGEDDIIRFGDAEDVSAKS